MWLECKTTGVLIETPISNRVIGQKSRRRQARRW